MPSWISSAFNYTPVVASTTWSGGSGNKNFWCVAAFGPDLRLIFADKTTDSEHLPSATPHELATAIIECIDAGARVINLSFALAQPSTKGEQEIGPGRIGRSISGATLVLKGAKAERKLLDVGN